MRGDNLHLSNAATEKTKDLIGCVRAASLVVWSACSLPVKATRGEGRAGRGAECRFHLLLSITHMSFTRSLSP